MDKKISPAMSDMVLAALEKEYGIPRPDLQFKNLYQLTVAVVLSAQTTDRQVNAVTGILFSRYPDFGSLAVADLQDIEDIVKSTGFYHNKAANIIGLSKHVVEKFSGSLPRTIDELTTLPGVGRKSANVILSIGFNIPALAVDTHVSRLAYRLGYTESNNPDRIEKDLCEIIKAESWTKTHLLFIKHGRSVCKARNPECEKCTLRELCRYFSGQYRSPSPSGTP